MTGFLRTSLGVCCIAASCAFADVAVAQPVGASIPSAEWLAAKARVIVRGVIEDLEKIDLSKRIVTFRVLETLKGEPVEQLQFVHDGFSSVKLSELHTSGQEVLLFLDDWTRKHFSRTAGHYVYTRFPLVASRVILLSPDKVEFAETTLPVYSRDLTPQRTPEMLSDTIGNYLKHRRDGELVWGHTISLPRELRGGYADVHFTFPGDFLATEKVVDFVTFKERFGKPAPAGKKPPYLRTQSGYIGVYALELMAADCDTIARGVIDDWCFVATTDDPTGDTCGVRMRVTESLKGGARKHVNFLMTDARDLAKLQADRQELVVFLRNRALTTPAAALGHQTRDGLWDDSVIVLDEQQAEALFATMTWHRKTAEILARLRTVIERDDFDDMDPEAVRLASQGYTGPPVFNFHPPASLVRGASIDGNKYSVAYLPVDAQLEQNARQWADSENKDLRWLAARAMIYFKSEENAALLRRLLDDEAKWPRSEMLRMLEASYPHEPDLLVRWEAWHVLRGWGYDVPKPKFVE